MGIYLNPGNAAFQEALRSKIYVDKTGLITCTNEVIGTKQKNICISRPRRFGKSMTAEMLAAYYGCGDDSRALFEPLEISKSESFEKHLNQYDVLFFNIQRFLSRVDDTETLTTYLQKKVLSDLEEEYGIYIEDKGDLSDAMEQIYDKTKKGFVFIIDEWDCIFREKNMTHRRRRLTLIF